jgi:hypothetical protein
MNLYHHWYFAFIFVVASGQWLKCEAAPNKGQSKDVPRKVNKRYYPDFGLGLGLDFPSDDSDFKISYNLAGNIKFKLGSKNPLSYLPDLLQNYWPTPEPVPIIPACPSYLISPTCEGSKECHSDYDCNSEEICCFMEEWIGYACCESIAQATTTTESEPDIYAFCPNSNSYLTCQREESCSSNTDCFSNETCCQIQELIAAGEPPCCVLYSDLYIGEPTAEDITETTETTTETYTTTDLSEIVTPDAACPNSDDYNPNFCYQCTPDLQREFCSQIETCCFSRIAARYCCYSNDTIFSTEATSSSTTTETPITTTTEASVPSTVFVKTCVIPPGVSHFYWPLSCVSSSQCPNATECCNGFAGAGCYDWPTRVPEPGSYCPRGYKTCVIQPGIEGAEGTPKSCTNDDYNTVCSESEYCCKVNNSADACCVEKNTELFWPER